MKSSHLVAPLAALALGQYESMSRDLTSFNAIPSLTNGLIVSSLGQTVAMYGNTGLRMAGGRVRASAQRAQRVQSAL